MSRTSSKITLDATERQFLQKIHHKRSLPEFLKQRLQVVLVAETGLEVHFIGMWRNRWATHYRNWNQTDETLRPEMNERLVLGWLADQK